MVVQAIDADVGSNIQVDRNNGSHPRLWEDTGEIISDAAQVFNPQAAFAISILVYDQSAFNFTS